MHQILMGRHNKNQTSAKTDDPTERMLCLKDSKEVNECRSNDDPAIASSDERIEYDDSALEKIELSIDSTCDAWHGNYMKGCDTLMEVLESKSHAAA